MAGFLYPLLELIDNSSSMTKKYLIAFLFPILFLVPSVSSAAALTQQQSTSLIAVVQSSPGTPASAFVNLITAFSNITINQATSLIAVVQASPSTPANAFVDLLTSFTADTSTAQATTPATNQVVTPTTPTPSVSSTQANSPWVDIKVAGSDGPITMPINGPALTISWTSRNVISCTIAGMPDGISSVEKSGSKLESFSTPQQNTVTINCSALVNNVVTPNAVSDSIIVNVTPATGPATPVSVSLGSSPTSVLVGASNAMFAAFNMRVNEKVEVNDLHICSTNSIHNGGLANGKIFLNGVQVGSTKNIVDCSLTSEGTDFSFGSSFILLPNVTNSFAIYGDAKTATSNLSGGETVQIKLVGQGSQGSNGQGQSSYNSYTVPSSDVLGGTVSIVAPILTTPILTAGKYSGYGNQSIPHGTSNAKIGAFVLFSSGTEGISVGTITINMSATNSVSIANLVLKDDATSLPIATTKVSPSTSNSFSVSLNIPTSGSKVIDVYGDILPNASADVIQLTLDSSTSGTGVSGGSMTSVTSPVSLQTITVQ